MSTSDNKINQSKDPFLTRHFACGLLGFDFFLKDRMLMMLAQEAHKFALRLLGFTFRYAESEEIHVSFSYFSKPQFARSIHETLCPSSLRFRFTIWSRINQYILHNWLRWLQVQIRTALVMVQSGMKLRPRFLLRIPRRRMIRKRKIW